MQVDSIEGVEAFLAAWSPSPYRAVVKPVEGAGSDGVSICDSRDGATSTREIKPSSCRAHAEIRPEIMPRSVRGASASTPHLCKGGGGGDDLGHTSATPRPHLGRTSAAPRPHLGQISAISRRRRRRVPRARRHEERARPDQLQRAAARVPRGRRVRRRHGVARRRAQVRRALEVRQARLQRRPRRLLWHAAARHRLRAEAGRDGGVHSQRARRPRHPSRLLPHRDYAGGAWSGAGGGELPHPRRRGHMGSDA